MLKWATLKRPTVTLLSGLAGGSSGSVRRERRRNAPFVLPKVPLCRYSQ